MRFKLIVNTGFANCQHEDEIKIDNKEWTGMSEREQRNRMYEELVTLRDNHIEMDWEQL